MHPYLWGNGAWGIGKTCADVAHNYVYEAQELMKLLFVLCLVAYFFAYLIKLYRFFKKR